MIGKLYTFIAVCICTFHLFMEYVATVVANFVDQRGCFGWA